MEVTSLVKGSFQLTTIESNRNSDSHGTISADFDVGGLLSITKHQSNYIKRLYREVVNSTISNGKIIHDYIVAEEAEINIQESTKGDKIKKLCLLSRFFQHRKRFTELSKKDILSYLNSLRKPASDDPTHRSVGTYNGRQMVFMKFYRWLYNADEPDHRKRITPPCMVGARSSDLDPGPGRVGIGNLDLDNDGQKDHPSESIDTLCNAFGCPPSD
jgi:hypothetical protein